MNFRYSISLLIVILLQVTLKEGAPAQHVKRRIKGSRTWNCFPSEAAVNLENGKSASMSELKVGDRVQTVSSSGIVSYNDVRIFLKKIPNEISWYSSIKTSLNKTISLSGNHLIYARCGTDKFKAIYAKEVSIGDEVLVDENNQLSPAMVIDTSTSKMQGAYVPMVMEGNIVVNGVLASCCASYDHDLSHFTMTLIGWFPYITELIFGNEKGSLTYVNVMGDMGDLLLPYQFLFNKE